MRKFGLFLIGATFIGFMSVTLVQGQGGDKKRTGGGAFGGGQQSPLNLLNRAEVKKELDLTDEQVEKLPAEVLLAISKVLNEKQYKRFKQIELQQRGNIAFKDTAVQKQLKVTDDQAKNIGSLLEDSAKESAELFKGLKGGGAEAFKGIREKQENIRKETRDKIFTVLTKDQRSAWREMIGEEFKLQQPTFGGGGGAKKKDEN